MGQMMTPTWQTACDVGKAHFVILHDNLQKLSVLSPSTTKVLYFNLLLIESIKVFHFEM